MKLVTFIFSILLFSQTSIAGTELLCSLVHAKKVIARAQEHSTYDKNRHCTVSCMLSLRCSKQEVMTIGLLKELKDLFGPGQADWEDIKADAFGISLAAKRAATTDLQCLSQCDLYYNK